MLTSSHLSPPPPPQHPDITLPSIQEGRGGEGRGARGKSSSIRCIPVQHVWGEVSSSDVALSIFTFKKPRQDFFLQSVAHKLLGFVKYVCKVHQRLILMTAFSLPNTHNDYLCKQDFNPAKNLKAHNIHMSKGMLHPPPPPPPHCFPGQRPLLHPPGVKAIASPLQGKGHCFTPPPPPRVKAIASPPG